MNARDILFYGNRTVLHSLTLVPEAEWGTEGVCGWWPVKLIIAHLASFEQVLIEVLGSSLEGGPTLVLDQFTSMDGNAFNDVQVRKRMSKSSAEVLAEYKETHARAMELIVRIPVETLRQVGTIPWYGMEYALDDLLVYQYYGHKREHTAQINVFTDRFRK